MDKLEYIPRDLVSVYVGIKKYIVEVIGTENENEVLSYQIKFPNGEIQYADKDNIVPISLTPEILEKNGWRTQNRWYYYLDVAEGFISYIEGTEKVSIFKDQNGKCLRFITSPSTDRLSKAMLDRKRRVKLRFLRH